MTAPQPSAPKFHLPAWAMKWLHALASGAVASAVNVLTDAQATHGVFSMKTLWKAVVIGGVVRFLGAIGAFLDG